MIHIAEHSGTNESCMSSEAPEATASHTKGLLENRHHYLDTNLFEYASVLLYIWRLSVQAVWLSPCFTSHLRPIHHTTRLKFHAG